MDVPNGGGSPPPFDHRALVAVLVVLRELGIDVRDSRERDRLGGVDLPDGRRRRADPFLAVRAPAPGAGPQATGVDALHALERFYAPLPRGVTPLHGLLADRADAH